MLSILDVNYIYVNINISTFSIAENISVWYILSMWQGPFLIPFDPANLS